MTASTCKVPITSGADQRVKLVLDQDLESNRSPLMEQLRRLLLKRFETAPPQQYLPTVEGQNNSPPRFDDGPPGGRMPPDFPKTILRSEDPRAYWLLVRLPGEPLGTSGPLTLLGRTPALGISPLMLNPRPWILCVGGIVLFSTLFWIPLARNLTASISSMTRATESIAEGRFDVQFVEAREDELGRLSHAINRMAERLKDFVTGHLGRPRRADRTFKFYLGCCPRLWVGGPVGAAESERPHKFSN